MGKGPILVASLLLALAPAYASAHGRGNDHRGRDDRHDRDDGRGGRGHGHGHDRDDDCDDDDRGHGHGHGHGHGNGNSKRLRIAWLANDQFNTYDGAAIEGGTEVANANRASIETYFAGFDPDVQLDQCMSAVRSKRYDALIVMPADSVGIIPCVREAKRRDIPVVAVDLPIGPDLTTLQPQVPGQVGAVLVPPADWGRALGLLVQDLCSTETNCEVGYIAGAFSVALDQFALDELDRLDANNPHIRIVARDEAFYTRELAAVAAQNMLAEHPNIRVMIGAGDQMAQGIEETLAANPSANPVKIIVGAGAGEYGVQAVRDGRWYATFVALPRDEGTIGTEMAIRAARGKRIREPGVNPVDAHGWPAFFTSENQDEFVGFEPQWR